MFFTGLLTLLSNPFLLDFSGRDQEAIWENPEGSGRQHSTSASNIVIHFFCRGGESQPLPLPVGRQGEAGSPPPGGEGKGGRAKRDCHAFQARNDKLLMRLNELNVNL
jgi:hypothetical protein